MWFLAALQEPLVWQFQKEQRRRHSWLRQWESRWRSQGQRYTPSPQNWNGNIAAKFEFDIGKKKHLHPFLSPFNCQRPSQILHSCSCCSWEERKAFPNEGDLCKWLFSHPCTMLEIFANGFQAPLYNVENLCKWLFSTPVHLW